MLILLSSKAGIIIGFLIIFISALTLIITYFRKKAAYIIGVLTLVFLLFAYYLVNHNLRFQILLNRINSEHIHKAEKRDMRLDVWYSSIQVIQENFLFGVGAGDIKDNLFEKYEANNFHTGVERQYNSHQQFLETFIGQGIIGLFLLLFLLVIPFYKSIEEKNFLWFSLVFIVFMNFLFESMLNTIAGVTFFGFFYSLITFVPYIDTRAKIPFSPPRIDHKIIHEVVDTLQSGWITTGPKTKRFENMITKYCGCEETLCVNSATSGLKLILRWFGVGPGDEVIIPAYTYSATANVVVQSGAKLIFVDVNETDFNISVQEIEKAITSKTKVIIPVDFSGFPCDYDELNSLVNNEKIKNIFQPENKVQKALGRILLLSDSAHSLGAEYKGKKSGSLTDISVFSFHAVKNLTTGEGGAICFNFKEVFKNDELYHQLNILALHGQTKDAFQKSNDGNWKYDIIDAGYKSNMTDILASMGLVELERYEIDDLPKYKYIFDKYSEALKEKEWAILPLYETPEKKSSYHIYPLRIRNIDEQTRDEIMKRIIDENVAVNVHFMPVPMFTFYKKMGYSIENYKQAYKNYSCEITLPAFYDLTDSQIDRVIKVLVNSVEAVLNMR
ncbi:MAG: aminotransferase class I/II-fold pyridoxal phosphate-dependent enzyme [Chlorobi bacterium]|nr:aminotransferase class I/II-fold pyridoxal phosphate-dependent enzyme [Chlorobiota bacterium]